MTTNGNKVTRAECKANLRGIHEKLSLHEEKLDDMRENHLEHMKTQLVEIDKKIMWMMFGLIITGLLWGTYRIVLLFI